jgi:hypothetical protein
MAASERRKASAAPDARSGFDALGARGGFDALGARGRNEARAAADISGTVSNPAVITAASMAATTSAAVA